MSERLYYFKAGDGNEYGPISAEEVPIGKSRAG